MHEEMLDEMEKGFHQRISSTTKSGAAKKDFPFMSKTPRLHETAV
jgi:hypothetical protein